MKLSVAICSHNPKANYLNRVIQALSSQSLDQSHWELVLIDNASPECLSTKLVSWHENGRVIRENQLGLTHARLRAIRESSGNILVFVDDDNLLNPDYLEVALEISDQHPHIGAWSGQCHAEFETTPAPWVHRYQGMLVIREFTEDVWSNLAHLPETMPCGAGLCVRRSVALAYADLHDSGKRPMLLDRQGTSLMSAGDNDLAACACDLGLGMGLFHSLELTHLIAKERTTQEYLARLAEGIHYSTVHLESLRGKKRREKSMAKRILQFIQLQRKSGVDRSIFAAWCRGEDKAIKELYSRR